MQFVYNQRAYYGICYYLVNTILWKKNLILKYGGFGTRLFIDYLYDKFHASQNVKEVYLSESSERNIFLLVKSTNEMNRKIEEPTI